MNLLRDFAANTLELSRDAAANGESYEQIYAAINAITERVASLQQINDLQSGYFGSQMGLVGSVLDAAPDAMVLSNSAGNIIFFNTRAEAMFGYPRDEVTGKKMEILIPPRLRELHQGHMDRYFANPEVRGLRSRNGLAGFTKSGTEFPVDINLSYTDTPAGMLTVSAIRNITDEKKRLDEISAREQRLSDITALVPGVIYRFKMSKDNLPEFLMFSDGLKQLFGVLPEEAYANALAILGKIHPDDAGRVLTTLADANKSCLPLTQEFRISMPDGTTKWICANCTPSHDETGCTIRTGIMQDATASVLAEKQLRESEIFSRDILDALASHIAVVDPSGRVVATNKAWDDFSQWNESLPLPRVPVGSNIFDIRNADAMQGNTVSAAVTAGIGSVLKKEIRFSEIQYSAEVDGNRRWFLLRITYAGNEYPKVVLAHSDITGIKLAELETERTKERYRELLDNTGEMVNFVGVNGNMIWANNAWKKSLHYSDDDIAKMKISNVFGPETAKGFGERMAILRSGKTISDHYATMVAKNGTTLNVHGSVVPVMENDRFSGTMGFFRNITDLHREREQRLKSETRLQQTLDHMGIGCMILDFEYTYIFANHAAATQAFQTPSNLIGKKMSEMYPGVEKSRVFAKYREAMQERTSVNFEEKYVFENGSERWFEFKVEPVEQGIFILSSDVTERKKASEEIRKSRMLLADSQRLAQLGSWELNLITRELVWTDEIYRIAEIEKTGEGAPFEAFLNLIHPEDRMNRDALFSEAIANHTRYDTIHRLLFPDGRIKYVRVQAEAFYGDDGTPMRALGMVQDITSQREAELLSLENENKYRQVVSNITDGLFIDDLEGRVTFANEVFLQIFGLDASDINNLFIEDYVAPESVQRVRQYHDDRIAGLPAPEFYEYEGLRKDGSRRWLQVRVSKVYEHGVLKGTQTALRDITERKQAEDLLACQNAELKKINSELDRFVYSTSHDLRAPLLSLIGLIDLCKGTDDRLELDSFIHMMEKSAFRLDNTIKEILEYSRNSRMELYYEEVDISNMVAGLLEDIIHHDKAQRVRFTKNIATGIPFVTDRLRLATIMNNLVGNAVKYQRVDEPNPRVDITFSVDEKGGTLTVTDNGEGISANVHEKVFEMFYRNSQNSVGSGLGLYLCKEIVHKMDGEIKLTSESGKGSTFIVKLPNMDFRKSDK